MAAKKKHIVNWNWITMIFTIGGIIITLILNYNQREIDILKSELEKSEKENDDLLTKIDPEWHIKFNNQKQYYEGELAVKNELINKTNSELDSIVRNQPALILSVENRQFKLSDSQFRKLVYKLVKAEEDSILISQVYKPMVKDLKSLDSLHRLHINNLEQIDSLRILQLNEHQERAMSTDKKLSVLQLIALFSALLSLFMGNLMNNRKNTINKT